VVAVDIVTPRSPIETRLIAEIEDIRATIKHADIKASALLSWIGAVLVIVAAVLASGGQGDNPVLTVALIAGWAGAGLMAVAVIELVYVVRSSLTGTGWTRYAEVRSLDELVSIVSEDIRADEARRIELLASRLMSLTAIAKRKTLRIRYATNFLISGIITLVAAACLFAIGG
jgi:hypothetical protein